VAPMVARYRRAAFAGSPREYRQLARRAQVRTRAGEGRCLRTAKLGATASLAGKDVTLSDDGLRRRCRPDASTRVRPIDTGGAGGDRVVDARVRPHDPMTPDQASHPMRPLRFATVAIPVALILAAVAPSTAASPAAGVAVPIRRADVALPAPTANVGLVAPTTTVGLPTSTPNAATPIVDRASTFARASEIHRIRTHFDSVLTELAERDVSTLL